MTTNRVAIDMRIECTPQEIIVKTLKTIPNVPCESKFKFFANGIQEPELSGDEGQRQENNKRYLSNCASAGVIPYSGVSMEYIKSEDKELFIPKASCYGRLISYDKEESVNALLNGGKIHKINLETSIHNNGFEIFRQKFLQTLINNAYVLDSFNLCLTIKYHEPNSTLKFNTQGREKGLILHLPDESKNTNNLETWFKSLREYKE